jgi:hypothetical protein
MSLRLAKSIEGKNQAAGVPYTNARIMGTRLMMARDTATPRKVKSQGLMRSIFEMANRQTVPGDPPPARAAFRSGYRNVPAAAGFGTGNAGPRAAILWILCFLPKAPAHHAARNHRF